MATGTQSLHEAGGRPRRGSRRALALGAGLAAGFVAVGLFVAAGLEATGGVPATPLDDPYIHFQYARTIAEGRPFRYHVGEPASSGASSLAYVALLTVPHVLGLGGLPMVWVAWGIGALAFGALIWAAARVASRVVGPRAWLGGALALALWSAMGWHAASGMEVALAAALVMVAWHVGLDWRARAPVERTSRRAAAMIALAFLLPLTRPESAPLAMALGAMLALWPVGGRGAARWWGLGCVSGILFHPLFWWVVTGSHRTNGAAVKWLPQLPYMDGKRLWDAIVANLEPFYHFWIDEGGRRTGDFFPPWVAAVAVPVGMALVLVVTRPARRSALALLIGGTLACLAGTLTFAGFADHRFRYVMPYVPPLLVMGTAVFHDPGRVIEAATGQRFVAGALALGLGLSFLGKWDPALAHFGRAAGEVAGQHYDMARKIGQLPPGAYVAINDAGVLTYFGRRRTFDVVGLTSNFATPYFPAGGGSHFEMFEAMEPDDRPTHFAIYRYWWKAPFLLGRLVGRAHTPRGPLTIVGWTVMDLYEARYQDVGKGEMPVLIDPPGELVDAIDVADVPDERAHDYDVEGDRYRDDVHRSYTVSGVGRVHEGGRAVRTLERMEMAGVPGKPLVLVLRTNAWMNGELLFEVNDSPVGRVPVSRARRWVELAFKVPAEHVRRRNRVVVRRGGGRNVAAFHWWAFAPPE